VEQFWCLVPKVIFLDNHSFRAMLVWNRLILAKNFGIVQFVTYIVYFGSLCFRYVRSVSSCY
jgi:hypothetical protein